MALLEITLTGQHGGPPLLHERFELAPDLALELMARLETMLADLPGRHQVIRARAGGDVTIFEVTLNHRPPVASPTFQELFGGSIRPKKGGSG
jgi:hypothetical protein